MIPLGFIMIKITMHASQNMTQNLSKHSDIFCCTSASVFGQKGQVFYQIQPVFREALPVRLIQLVDIFLCELFHFI